MSLFIFIVEVIQPPSEKFKQEKKCMEWQSKAPFLLCQLRPLQALHGSSAALEQATCIQTPALTSKLPNLSVLIYKMGK